MPDLKKVIDDLKDISKYFFEVYRHENEIEESALALDRSYIIDDAIELLKEQEPRVLEYSEIEKHPLVWLEDNDKEDVIPALFLQYNGWNVEFSVQAPDEFVDTIFRDAVVVTFKEMYGTTWRAWTSRPSPEQMRDTPWEEMS